MITSLHTMIYSDDPAKTRAFLKDVLGWPSVEHGESSAGWLIFRSGPSEMGVHPTSGVWEGKPYQEPLHHTISLMCDDIRATIAELRGKGAEFRGDVEDQGFGLTINLILPGAGEILLYEPRHPLAFDL